MCHARSDQLERFRMSGSAHNRHGGLGVTCHICLRRSSCREHPAIWLALTAPAMEIGHPFEQLGVWAWQLRGAKSCMVSGRDGRKN